jgi:hypothetical protein
MKAQNSILLLFGILLFATAIYFGVKTVNLYSASANRDLLVSTVYDCGLIAQKHYRDAVEKDQDKSFKSWALPKNFQNTEYGYFRAHSSDNHVDILGVGNQTGRNGFTNVRVTARVDSSGIKVTVIN